MSPPTRSKRSKTTSSRASQGSRSLDRTEIAISVYDLLPPGRLSSFLWTIGSALLHSGVVINGREYAYGGHGQRNVTGVYWTKPQLEPPGGTFRVSILQGVTYRTPSEIEAILKDVSEEFLGPRYNLLTNNCNHFTSALCLRLTGKPGPAWLNRAAGIGVALPCMVPKEWIAPPDFETAEGELLDEDEDAENEILTRDDAADENTGMLSLKDKRASRASTKDDWDKDDDDDRDRGYSLTGGRRITHRDPSPPPRLVDTSGRTMPVAERAPLPQR